MSNKTKKQLLLNLPYFIAGLVCTNLGEAWRIAEGADMSEKLLGFLSALGAAFSNPMPSLHPMDLLIGVCFPGERVMLLIHRSVDLHQQVADVEKNLRLFSKMIGPHFLNQSDGAVLDRVELDGIEQEQIFLIFGSVFHQAEKYAGHT